MTKVKGGFTLIEVSLFLAITGLLFLGVTIGVQNSIFQQRYNDSVQNFAEFLRSAYAKTENVQNIGTGDTKQAIYGKLITFGEAKNLTGDENNGEVFMYDVVGDAKCKGSFNGTLEALKVCNAEVLKESGKRETIGLAEGYRPKWSAAIQTTDSEPFKAFKGAILITRHPQSGTINTFPLVGNTVEINEGKTLRSYLMDNNINFASKQVDFCVNPNGYNDKSGGIRTDVRIEKGARNSAGVEIMPDDKNDCVSRG